MAPRLKTQESTIRVDHRPAAPDLSYIPSELADYFESRGERVTLASKLDQEIAKLSCSQRFPLAADEIPPEIRGEGNRNLARYGFRLSPEGFVSKGDCFLFIQPHSARDAELAAGYDEWLSKDSEAYVDGQVDSINDLFMRDPNASRLSRSRVSVEEAGSLSSHAGLRRGGGEA